MLLLQLLISSLTSATFVINIFVLFIALVSINRCDSHSSVSPENNFNNFDDNLIFSIKWPGHALKSDDELKSHENTVFITTADKEKYQCILPSTAPNYEHDKEEGYDGMGPLQLLKPLFHQMICSYRLDQYWTYELCHGKHFRQYHEENTVSMTLHQEFLLGRYSTRRYDEDVIKYKNTEEEWRLTGDKKIPTIKIEGTEYPYFEVNMTDGSVCDITGRERFTRVLYICKEDGKHEIHSSKEPSSCEYEVIVFSKLLCLHPDYRIEQVQDNNINCYPREDAPTKPKSLMKLESDMSEFMQSVLKNMKESVIQEKSNIQGQAIVTPVYDLSPHDPELFEEFLNGDYCLQGGSGWWKYKFCYGKKVEQYHQYPEGRKIIITLGKWNLDKHKEWLEENASKRPKVGTQVKYVNHFYGEGDLCDETKKPRQVEVRLKCKEVKGHSEAVSLYMLEPNVCEYILVVESPIICPLLQKIDRFGLLQLPVQ